MQAVIPAAGEGTRLRPLTDTRPKALVEVAGRPILTHCFEQVLELPVSEFLVIVDDRGDQIREAYGEPFGDVKRPSAPIGTGARTKDSRVTPRCRCSTGE